MKIRILPIILFLFFIFVFIIFYKGLKNSNIYVPKLDLNKEIPFFTAKSFNNLEYVRADDFFKNDQFYLVNIWSSWCVPCRDEHAFLKKLSDVENIIIVGLNYKDKIKNAKNFLNELGNPYDMIFLDPDGTIAIEWGAYGVPESYLIYKKKIIKKVIGPLDDGLLIEINELIK